MGARPHPKHRNRRPEYLKAWRDVVHRAYVGQRLDGIRAGKKRL